LSQDPLEDRVKGYKHGTHRLFAPRETLARLRPLLLQMGITRLANVTGLDHIGIPVVMACRPNARSLAVSQGKGLDLDAAKVSAAMESIESYHAEHIRHSLQFATYTEMKGRYKVADVDQLLRSADSHFHSNLPILWIEGRDWSTQEPVWAPYQMVHLAYAREWRFDLRCFLANSTGLASGNHILEAASHAICEIVERDAFRRWETVSESMKDAHRVDLYTVEDPLCREALDRYDRAGVAVAVWEIPHASGLPVFECLIADRSIDPLRPVCAAGGAGCHTAREIALLRALTEAAQSRLTAIAGSRDDMLRHDFARWFDLEVLAEQSNKASVAGTRAFSLAPTNSTDSFGSDIDAELEGIRTAGFPQAIVFDLTHPELAIPVVRVLIPGMEILPREDGKAAGSRRQLPVNSL
jgi:YcaO-like protein with predicted kinase domain